MESTPGEPVDLAVIAFASLCDLLFDKLGDPIPFRLPDKGQTQDDPFDQFLIEHLATSVPDAVLVISSGKKLVSPDLLIARVEDVPLLIGGGKDLDSECIIAIEVKKVDASDNGKVARASGIDYNSTPPASAVKVHAKSGNVLLVPAYYLFAVLLRENEEYVVSSLALVAGGALNKNQDLYDSITGVREKSIGLGTYGDGLNRNRPMMVFANPLGWTWLAAKPTLIHTSADVVTDPQLVRVREMRRGDPDGGVHVFWCYRHERDAEENLAVAVDPFPTPKGRTVATSPRGVFRVTEF